MPNISDDKLAVIEDALVKAQASLEAAVLALRTADAAFDVLDPSAPSGLSDAETAALFNSARSLVKETLGGPLAA